jgi:hypothetical protein
MPCKQRMFPLVINSKFYLWRNCSRCAGAGDNSGDTVQYLTGKLLGIRGIGRYLLNKLPHLRYLGRVTTNVTSSIQQLWLSSTT